MIVRPSPKNGFTLIEILLSVAILGAVVLAIYSSWTAIIRGSDIGKRAALEAQRTRMTVRLLEESLASAVMFEQNIAYYGFESDTSGDFAFLSFTSRLPESFPGSGLFPGQPLRRIAFFVDKGGSGGNDLVMTQVPLLQVLESNEEPYPIVLARNVQAFELEFWDPQIEDWETEWVQTNQMPQMVRASLEYGGGPSGRDASRSFALTTVALPGMVVPIEYQAPNTPGGSGGDLNRRGGGGSDDRITIDQSPGGDRPRQ